MTNSKIEKDIRIEFKNFDPSVLLGVEDVRKITGAKNAAAVYAQVYRGDLPEPLIKKNRQLRWSVGQVRGHLQALHDDLRQRQEQVKAATGASGQAVAHEGKKRTGRPRIESRPFL